MNYLSLIVNMVLHSPPENYCLRSCTTVSTKNKNKLSFSFSESVACSNVASSMIFWPDCWGYLDNKSSILLNQEFLSTFLLLVRYRLQGRAGYGWGSENWYFGILQVILYAISEYTFSFLGQHVYRKSMKNEFSVQNLDYFSNFQNGILPTLRRRKVSSVYTKTFPARAKGRSLRTFQCKCSAHCFCIACTNFCNRYFENKIVFLKIYLFNVNN